MERMTHVWKCDNWNKLMSSLQKQHPQSSSFHNLTTISMWSCKGIRYLFSPLMAKLLSNVEEIKIQFCEGIEEVVSNRDHEEIYTHTPTDHFFPHLHSLSFLLLKNLKRIGGGECKLPQPNVASASWSLCQYSKEIEIVLSDALSSVVPAYAVGNMQKLQVLKVSFCTSLIEVFETQGINKNNGGNSGNIDEGNDVGNTTIPRLENINVPQLSNLKQLVIKFCNSLQFVFTFSTLESLKHLEELIIENCEAMKVIVKEDNIERRKDVGFPRLKFLKLHKLPNLEGFYLGMNDFRWPSLEKVMIDFCPKLMVFTSGHSTAPKLEYMHTSLGKHSLECGLNFHVTTNQTQLPGLESTNLERLPSWSFHNLIEIDMKDDWEVKCIIPSNELQHLQKLERIRLSRCRDVKEVFDESETVVEIPNLTQVELINLWNLKYIWTSNDHGKTLLKFPNLTTLSVYRCNKLKHVFTSSMVGSLLQLQDLHISYCALIDAIVKEKEGFECDANVKEIVLPCLKSLKLDNLKCLEGFCLGRSDFSFPALHTLEIRSCPEITVFTNGRLDTPALNIIDTNFGRCYIREDINTFIKNIQDEGFQF